MNSHYDPLLILKYLNLDSKITVSLPIHHDSLNPGPMRRPRGQKEISAHQRTYLDDLLQQKFAILRYVTEYYATIDNTVETMVQSNPLQKAEIYNQYYDEAANFYVSYADGDECWKLVRLYATMRKRFYDELQNPQNADPAQLSPEFLQHIADLLILGSILKGVHRHAINVPRLDRTYLRDQKRISTYLLDVAGIDLEISWESESTIPEYGTQTVRDTHLFWNVWRLLLLRLRRLISLLALLLQGDFLQGFRAVELGGTLLFFSYLAWIFFLPRFLTNLGLIYKHVFDESAMTEVEKRLGWRLRLWAQVVRRGQEVANDTGWLGSGIVTCFFLATQAPIVGLYLAVAMQAYDLLVTTVRCIIEYRRLSQLKRDLERIALENNCPNAQQIEDINARIQLDLLELAYVWFNFLVLLACAIVLAQVFASLGPWMPIIAAAVAVGITLVTYFVTQRITQERRRLYDGVFSVTPKICYTKDIQESEFPSFQKQSGDLDLDKITLGIFTAGYLRILNDQGVLVNLIYLNKETQQIVDFSKAFRWDRSCSLSQFDPSEIEQLKECLKSQPTYQMLLAKIENTEDKKEIEVKKLLFTPEETDTLQQCLQAQMKEVLALKLDRKIAQTINDLVNNFSSEEKFKVVTVTQKNALVKKLTKMQHDATPLTVAEVKKKTRFWRDVKTQTSKSVHAFSNTVLGMGG